MSKEGRSAAVGDAALFSGRRIGEHVVREWSYRQAHDLLPVLIACTKQCQAKGITLDAFEEKWDELLLILVPYGPAIISRSLRIEEKDVWEKGFAEVGALLYAIVMENKEHIKNWIGPATGTSLTDLVAIVGQLSGPQTSS